MLLLRCISDSVDFEGVLLLVDGVESSQLVLPLGQCTLLFNIQFSVES